MFGIDLPNPLDTVKSVGGGGSDFLGKYNPFAGPDRAASAAQQAGEAQVASAQQGIGEAQAGVGMAQSEVGMANDAVQRQIAQRQQAIAQVQSMAALQPQEIAQISQILQTRNDQLQASLTSISKQQDLLDQAAPTMRAAGQNLYDLMMGKAADILKPLQQQQQLQRQKLMDNLSATMGPGFMSSTAGIQALTSFDTQAAMASANAQMQAVGQVSQTYLGLSQLQQSGQQAITQQTGEAYQRAQSASDVVLQANQVAQQRQIQGTLGAMQANQVDYSLPVQAQQNLVKAQFGLVDAQNQMTSVAGNPFAGQYMSGVSNAAMSERLRQNFFPNANESSQMVGNLSSGAKSVGSMMATA